MPTAPDPAIPGEPFFLVFQFLDFESGILTDPISLTMQITYGDTGTVVAGPFTYAGGSSAASSSIWRTGTGSFEAWWDVPGTNLADGVYVASWTAVYGPSGDEFLATENFQVLAGAGFTGQPGADLGYWTGSITYQPLWSQVPFVINFGEVDATGTAWLWQSITGWDGVQTAGSVVQRSADHGGWAAAQYYAPRTITLTVMASAPDQATRDVARAALHQAVPVSDLATLVYGEPVPKQAYVRLNSGAAITETCMTLTDVQFAIPLIAPDPRKYETAVQSPQALLPSPLASPLILPFTAGLPQTFPAAFSAETSSVVAVNAGNFETRPTITITGPVTNPAAVNATTGQAISFSGLVMAQGDVMVLDTDNRQSFLNNVFYPADPTSAWWTLAPGANTIQLGGSTAGGATLEVAFSSAWI